MARLPGDPPSPPRRVPPPTAPLKAPVKYGVGGGGTGLGAETPTHSAGGPSTALGTEKLLMCFE